MTPVRSGRRGVDHDLRGSYFAAESIRRRLDFETRMIPLTTERMEEVAGWVRAGPDIDADGVVRRRRRDLAVRISDRFGVTLAEHSVGDLLYRLGFRHLSCRLQHPRQAPQAIEAHKKLRGLGHRGDPGACRESTARTVVARQGPRRAAGNPELRLGREGIPTAPAQGHSVLLSLHLRHRVRVASGMWWKLAQRHLPWSG